VLEEVTPTPDILQNDIDLKYSQNVVTKLNTKFEIPDNPNLRNTKYSTISLHHVCVPVPILENNIFNLKFIN